MGVTGCGRHVLGYDKDCWYCRAKDRDEEAARKQAQAAEDAAWKENRRQEIRESPPDFGMWAFIAIAVALLCGLALGAWAAYFTGHLLLVAGISLLVATYWWPEKVPVKLVKRTAWRRALLILMVAGGVSGTIMVANGGFSGSPNVGWMMLAGLVYSVGVVAAYITARKTALKQGLPMPARARGRGPALERGT